MEDGNIWLHTRGLRKFGRPDISIENVPESEENKVVRIANQMIYYSSLGVLFNKKVKLHLYKDKEEADKKYQYILRRIPHIIIED